MVVLDCLYTGFLHFVFCQICILSFCILSYLYFGIFPFCSICTLFHLYFVAFVFSYICILAICILFFCILSCLYFGIFVFCPVVFCFVWLYFVLFVLWNICILTDYRPDNNNVLLSKHLCTAPTRFASFNPLLNRLVKLICPRSTFYR